MKRRIWTGGSTLFACFALFAVVGTADTLSIDGVWHTQYELMPASGGMFATEYTATQKESVLITGYYDNTDQYKVFVNGSLALMTPAITASPMDYGDGGMYGDPASAYASGLFSAGSFFVFANDVIKINDVGPLYPDPAQGVGVYDAQVGVQAVPPPAVPEPATLSLTGATLAAAWFLKRRRSA